MPTVHSILKESGFTDDQIAAMEPKAITAFSNVLTTAEQAREAAETAQRSYTDLYENRIVPSLAGWDEERTRMDNERASAMAEAAFYRTQNEQARATGFVPSDAPGYQPRDAGGRYVAGANATPGSPAFFDVSKVYEKAGDAIGILADVDWEHRRLFDKPMPISPSELVRRADAVKLDPRAYASREFHFDERRQQMQEEAKKRERDAIVKETEDRVNRTWAERVGSNPDVRMPSASRYAEAQKAVRAGTMPDPLSMSEGQRRAATTAAIRKDISENNAA
jgi:hypothetical protein